MFAWDWPLLHSLNLTELIIEGHSHGPRPTLPELLLVLSKLTMLEHLDLKKCMPILTCRVRYVGDDCVDLPKLNFFWLEDSSPFALYAVAAHVRVPTTARFVISLANYSLSGQQEVDLTHCQVLSEAIQSHVFADGPRSMTPRPGIALDRHLVICGSDEDHIPRESTMDFGTMHYRRSDDASAPFDFVRRGQSWDISIRLKLSWEANFEPNVAYTNFCCSWSAKLPSAIVFHVRDVRQLREAGCRSATLPVR